MQVQTQQKCSNSLTQTMIPYSHTMVQSFKALESRSTLTLTKINTIHDFTYKFALIFQSTFASAHSRSKRLKILMKWDVNNDESTIWTYLGLYFNEFSVLKSIFCLNN
ncbi:hypothetical protein H5410_020977 [Solanum commersonii]|uniref:Uncharacterized protein n=1 Tax=Solanum commersonii TaxID=4109 RepID=A0A9J5ZCW3_SOLCO|nr:hypothetical protein H5410_020977 [Solanum commersonii]